MKLTVVGSGDAFGSGGRLQTAFHLSRTGGAMLIDCGATTMTGLARSGLPAGKISTILVSHLHGDHFAGLVWLLLHAQHIDKRKTALTVAGPAGIEARVMSACEVLFPGSTAVPRRFDLRFVELRPGPPTSLDGAAIKAFEVRHPSGAPALALRVECEDGVVAYSGDTDWVDALVDCAQGADLYITECSGYDRTAPYHLSWKVLAPELQRMKARRIMLTHMGDDMLARVDEARAAGLIIAEDGLTLEV